VTTCMSWCRQHLPLILFAIAQRESLLMIVRWCWTGLSILNSFHCCHFQFVSSYLCDLFSFPKICVLQPALMRVFPLNFASLLEKHWTVGSLHCDSPKARDPQSCSSLTCVSSSQPNYAVILFSSTFVVATIDLRVVLRPSAVLAPHLLLGSV